MSTKRTSSLTIKDIERKAEYVELDIPNIEECFEVLVHEEKIREASRPLYLARYE